MAAILRVLLALIVLTVPLHARGGGGGHYKGNGTTAALQALFPGWTIKNFITDYTATCDGVANDDVARAAWVAEAVGQNPGRILLYVPPGSACITSAGTWTWDGDPSHPGIQNAIIWGYGATFNKGFIGGNAFPFDTTQEALIADASAGATTVTVTDGHVGRLSPGDWVCVCGLALQAGGYPANFQFFEYRLITSIVGTTVTLNAPLSYDYKSTWPLIDTNPTQGPAILLRMLNSWTGNVQVFGITFTSPFEVFSGKTIQVTDIVIWQNDPQQPTFGSNQSFFANFSALGSVEVDKGIELGVINQSTVDTFTIQSPVTQLVLDNVTAFGSFNGLGTNTVARGGGVAPDGSGGVTVNPIFYGQATSLVVDGFRIPAANKASHYVDMSSMSFSAGTFTIARNAAQFSNAVASFVPGHDYYLSDTDGTVCTPTTTFRVNGVRGDVTNIYVDTNMPSLPGTPPKCSGVVDWKGTSGWPQQTIKQLNSPAGSVPITQYAP